MHAAPTNTPRTLALGLAIGVVIVALTGALAGPIDPPPGPVASTNKTLEEVEPRTPLAGPGLITIGEPGSYYLTGNIEATGTAVQITTDGVTLDLNGYTIEGPGGIDIGSFGIQIDLSRAIARPVVILNGTVTNFGRAGIVSTQELDELVLSDLTISRCEVGVQTAARARIERVAANVNDTDGFSLSGQSVIRASTARSNGGTGFRVQAGSLHECLADANAGDGFSLGGFAGDLPVGTTLRGCTSTRNTLTGFDALGPAVFEACTATGNTVRGFQAVSDVVYRACNASENAGTGYFVDQGNAVLEACAASSNTGNGITVGRRSVLHACTASENTSFGIRTSRFSLVTSCVAGGNTFDGYNLAEESRAYNCTAADNLGDGFFIATGGTLDSCSAMRNGEDDFVGSLGSLVIRCTARNNTDSDFMFSSSSRRGTVITPTGEFSSLNAFANISY